MLNPTTDENVDAPIVDALRKVGHQVSYVCEMDPVIEDTQVLALANEGRSLLLTADKDFGELVYRQGLVHGGVILFRLAGLSATKKKKAMSALYVGLICKRSAISCQLLSLQGVRCAHGFLIKTNCARSALHILLEAER